MSYRTVGTAAVLRQVTAVAMLLPCDPVCPCERSFIRSFVHSFARSLIRDIACLFSESRRSDPGEVEDARAVATKVSSTTVVNNRRRRSLCALCALLQGVPTRLTS